MNPNHPQRAVRGLAIALLCLARATLAGTAGEEPPVSATGAEAPSAQPEPDAAALTFGMTPVVGVASTRTRFAPLAAHLAEQLGRPVQLLVTGSYGELVDRVARGQVDLVKLSPLAYVRARHRLPELELIALQVARGSTDYSSYLVARRDNPHALRSRLAGARACFADPGSTSGYLFPLAWLRRNGLDPETALGAVAFGGDHRACLEGLFAGRWDVAATWTGALRDARADGRPVGDLVIVAKTGRIPYDAWCLRPGLDGGLSRAIRRILLRTNSLDREGRRVLAPTLGINGWVPVADETYDGVRRVEAELAR